MVALRTFLTRVFLGTLVGTGLAWVWLWFYLSRFSIDLPFASRFLLAGSYGLRAGLFYALLAALIGAAMRRSP